MPNPANNRTFSELYFSKLFLAVLALKIVAGMTLASHVLRDWFAPFINYFVVSGFSNPWNFFLSQGQFKAFPYPPGMLYVLALPRLLLAPLLSHDWQAVGPLHLLALRLPMLFGDLAIYSILGAWFKDRVRTVRYWYWCSPVVFYICYYHGQLDIIPTALFLGCLYFLEKRRGMLAMLLYGIALSTKSHLWIAFPFLLVYLRPIVPARDIVKMVLVCLAAYAALVLPYVFGPGYHQLVLEAEEQSWVFALHFPLGRWGTEFLLCPAALFFIFSKFSSYPRHNWDLTILFLGIVFCSFVLLVPPMPGWFLWSIPFITYYFCRGTSQALPLLSFSFFYLGYFLFGERSDLFESLWLVNADWAVMPAPIHWFNAPAGHLTDSLLFTLMQSSLVGCIMVMYTKGVRSNEVYSARSRPLMIGIAGDSGVGKDRLLGQLTQLFGPATTRVVSGDDYHRWERGDENWNVFTHLNLKGNRLHEQFEHAIALRNGREVMKVEYDHHNGRFTPASQVDSRQNILMGGLHTFALEHMRQLFDLKVFLDPDEKLRVFWKMQRDHQERGHSRQAVLASLKKRLKDRLASILPQKDMADLVVSFKPSAPAQLHVLSAEPELFLELTSKNSYNFEALAEELNSVPGVKAWLVYPRGLEKLKLSVYGKPEAEIVHRLALKLVPNLADLVGFQPKFSSGLDGVVQLALLICLSSNLRWKTMGVSA